MAPRISLDALEWCSLVLDLMPTWSPLGASGGPLGVSGGPLGVSGGPLGASGGPLGASGGPLGVSGGSFGTSGGCQHVLRGLRTLKGGPKFYLGLFEIF